MTDAAPGAERRRIRGRGTGESAWRAWFSRHPVPPLDAPACFARHPRLLVVAPHPDDEVLGAGGLMRAARAADREVRVVAVTDGQASHRGSTLWSPAELAAERLAESRRALAHLGIDTAICRLGWLDGGCARHEDDLGRMLKALVRPDDLVVTTWRLDGHPDHEATARACAAACASRGATLWEAPVWAWHWARPQDPALDWTRAVALALSPSDLQVKLQAVQAYRTQLLPDPTTGRDAIVPPHALERLARPFEVMFT
ncbi:PIG-L family deacetylase [Verticiella sediminum]|uniref:PIG-L family deacetylase n=2 Tax=Verticiella sediminum TaxID=1247510 RepID=A0A556APP5_9BURK|nr:PIG-L family deacetylase [Verticiella sediminum]